MGSLLALGAVVAAGSACAYPTSESALRARAAFDMNCAENQLRISDLGGGGLIGGGARGVQGCGQRATYVFDNNGGSWVMNSVSTPSQQPPSEQR